MVLDNAGRRVYSHIPFFGLGTEGRGRMRLGRDRRFRDGIG